MSLARIILIALLFLFVVCGGLYISIKVIALALGVSFSASLLLVMLFVIANGVLTMLILK